MAKLPTNVIILGIVSFLNDMASEMVYPIVPIFLTMVLGAPALVVGLIEGVADFSSKILMAFTGIVSDRLQKRKAFVSWGYSFAAFSHLIMYFATSWPLVLGGRLINRTGKGLRTSARDALITESTDKTLRGRSFGWHRMMDSLGAVVGPLLSIWILLQTDNNYHLLFLLAFIPALFGVLLIILFVKEKKKEALGLEGIKFQWKKTNDAFKIFLIISFIFTLGNSSSAFLILRAQDLGLSVTTTVFTYVLFNMIYSLFSMPAGIIADKIGSRKVLFAGFLIFSLVYFAFGLVSNSVWVWVLFPIYGLYMAITDGVGKSYISRLVPHEISASAFGIYDTTMGVGAFLASSIAGTMWTLMGARSPFLFGGVMSFLAAGLFFTLTKALKFRRPVV